MSGSLPFPNEFFFSLVEGMVIFHCPDHELLEMDKQALGLWREVDEEKSAAQFGNLEQDECAKPGTVLHSAHASLPVVRAGADLGTFLNDEEEVFSAIIKGFFS